MATTFSFGRFELRPAARELLDDGRPVALGARAFDVLQALIERRERVVPKDELLDIAWPGVVVEENNLQVQISTLRKLLGPKSIATIPGRGYRFAMTADESMSTAQIGATPLARSAAESLRGNLPALMTEVIGREDESRELSSRIGGSRVVTVTGAGGMGKTTLALAVATAMYASFADGVWLVELTPIADPSLLAQTVARTLQIAVSDPAAAQRRLVDVLTSQQLLLVLDNAEHVADAAGRLVVALTTHAPHVRVLVTSQRLLNIPGEVVFTLGPLATPSDEDLQAIESFGAIRLFVERARAVQRDFAITALNASVIADICRQLDGMPLAIELAAARVRLLGVHGLRSRLDERLRLLTGGSRAAVPRHQALLTTIGWSYGLLSETEQLVLRFLGVFVGGFSLELAQRVAGDLGAGPWSVIDALSALVDDSLVQVDAGDPPRYRLLESTRAYALERLTEFKESDEARRRHAHAVSDFFAETDEQRYGESGTLTAAEFMQKLAPELDNFRAAFDWSIGQGGDVQTAVTLVGAAALMLRWLGLSEEGLRRMLPLRDHLDHNVRAASQARFCFGLALLGEGGRLPEDEVLELRQRESAFYAAQGPRRRFLESLYSVGWSLSALGRFDETEDILRQMRQIELPIDPRWLHATRLNLEGQLYLLREQFEAAIAVQMEQRNLLLQAPGEEILLINCQNNLCAALNSLGRFEEAIAVAKSSVDHAGARMHGSLGLAMFQLLHAQLSLGRFGEAEQTVRKAMPGWKRDGVVLFGARHLAMLLAEQGRLEDAARVNGASAAYMRRSGSIQHPVRRQAYRRVMELLRAAGTDAIDVARLEREGEALDENAIAALCERSTDV